jgi:XTP/dITP diphosphohydrolase
VSERVLVATRSRHKLREIRQILEEIGEVELVDLDEAGVVWEPEEESIECHETFRENALAKARYYAARSGMRTVADDSGICVDALAGEPGVRSKRFSGRTDLEGDALDAANNALLVQRLQGAPPGARSAHYICVAAIVDPRTGDEDVFEGRCDGEILESERGAGGFGYDPLFFLPEEGTSFGELDPARKNLVSHRARAFRAAAPALVERAGRTGA